MGSRQSQEQPTALPHHIPVLETEEGTIHRTTDGKDFAFHSKYSQLQNSSLCGCWLLRRLGGGFAARTSRFSHQSLVLFDLAQVSTTSRCDPEITIKLGNNS
mgnify:CR=1 FL=1